VLALSIFEDELYVGGQFVNAGGISVNHIAKWNGTSWSAVGEGMDFPVYTLEVHGSELYAGGAFTIAGGNPASRVAKWNGTQWTNVDSGVDSESFFAEIFTLTSDTENNILYTGGNFLSAGGAAIEYIAEWSSPLSIFELNNQSSEFDLFPNPFSQSVTIKISNRLNNSVLRVSNMIGETMFEMQNISNGQSLDVGNSLESGIYMFQLIERNEVVASKKVIITK
jgi:hypothetical protein